MRHWRVLFAGMALSAGVGEASAAGKPRDQSWGKIGVTFEQYRADTLTCSNTAYGVQVTMLPKTAASLRIANESALNAVVGNLDPVQRQALLAASVTPGRVMFRSSAYQDLYDHAATYDVIEQLQVVVDHCLVDHGYRRFRLTGGQMRELNGLKKGTEARARYLYSLGADPRVLAAQAI